MQIKDKLAKLYPTVEDIESDRAHHKSWSQLAKAIGVTKHSLEAHRRILGISPEKKGTKSKQFATVTHKSMDEIIKEMVGEESKNIYSKYKVVDPIFYKDMRGYQGLEFVGVEQGTTWRSVSGLLPSALREV